MGEPGSEDAVTGGDEDTAQSSADHPPRQAEPIAEDFDWRGWVLVAALVVSFVFVPAALLVLPEAQGVVASLGLTLRDAYLVLPLVPAFVLGATAVWAALRARQN